MFIYTFHKQLQVSTDKLKNIFIILVVWRLLNESDWNTASLQARHFSFFKSAINNSQLPLTFLSPKNTSIKNDIDAHTCQHARGQHHHQRSRCNGTICSAVSVLLCGELKGRFASMHLFSSEEKCVPWGLEGHHCQTAHLR